MKLFGKEKKIGNKAYNILKINKNGFLIPDTYILEKKEINNFNYNLLQKNKKYILRPSFENEDTKEKSYAGFFNSLYPLKINQVIKTLNSKNIEKIFSGNGFILKSIIIQEFIETNIYGVYFTRDPNNIFKKGFYEIGNFNDKITSGKEKLNKSLNFFQSKELEIIGKKLENLFKYPQDIEFCIKNNKVIIFQSRNITSLNNYFYKFDEIKKINGVYKKIKFEEFYNKNCTSIFTHSIINKIIPSIYLDSNIYFKINFINLFLFKKYKSNIKLFDLFINKYKSYLFNKIKFNFIKILVPQKLDKKVLKRLFSNYKYSFDLFKKSNLDLNFNYKTNFITYKYLNIEKEKNECFKILEKLKKEILKNNKYGKNINYLKIQEFFDKNIDHKKIINNRKNINKMKFQNKIFFLNGKIINSKNNEIIDWIYKGKIDGVIVNLKHFKYKKNLNQILISENLDLDLYDKLEYISGIIIKNGNSLSHNSIILREYKIPSIINYNKYDFLKIGENFTL